MNTIFVYGTFVWPGKKKQLLPPPPSMLPDTFALEVLREYSATELIGKLYRREFGSGWSPVPPTAAAALDWYTFFSKTGKNLIFRMEGSGYWEVLNFRNESDEKGLYLAVALQYLKQKPAWAAFVDR
jgi:hypothetical protein